MLYLQPNDIFADHYRLVRLIDIGGFAEVWEAVFLNAGNTVALKIYPQLDAEGSKNIEREYLNQSELSHSHLLIARYLGFHERYPFLEMRYCSGGNTAEKIRGMSEAELAKCLFQVASALEYLHNDDRVHQDIKPNNILIDKKGDYYLSDLGLSIRLRKTIQSVTVAKAGSATQVAGTTPPGYRAPELCHANSLAQQPIKATDIWALGATFYELASGKLPFGDWGGCTQLSSPEPKESLPYSSGFNSLINRCLSKDAWDRPKAGEIKKMAEAYLDRKEWEAVAETHNQQLPLPEIIKPQVIEPAYTKPVVKNKRKVWPYMVSAILLAFFLIGVFVDKEEDRGQKRMLGSIELYYTKDITEAEVDSLSKFLNDIKFTSDKAITIQLAKRDDVYLFREVVKNGVDQDNEMVTQLKYFAAQLSSAVFNGAEVEVDACDKQLKTLKAIPMVFRNFGKLKVFDALQIFYTSDISDEEVNALGNYLVKADWGKGNDKTIQITKSGDTYQFKMVLKKGLEQDAKMALMFAKLALQLSQDVFHNKTVEFHACDEHLSTLRVYLMNEE